MIPDEYRKYERVVTVSVANFPVTWGDKAANLEKVESMVRAAADLGSNMIAFPEMALSGYECSDDVDLGKGSCEHHRSAAEPIPGPSTLRLAGLAKERDVYVLLGMPELDESSATVHNSVAVIGPEGILGKYRKLHLAPAPTWKEQACFTRGDDLPVFETRYGPIGVQICFDFWCFPETSRILWLKGARLLFNCTAASSVRSRRELITWQTACRGAESRVYTATANLTGKDRKGLYYGFSNICGPDYPNSLNVFAQGGDREELVTATLSFDRLHYYSKMADLKKQVRLDLIAREYSRLAGEPAYRAAGPT